VGSRAVVQEALRFRKRWGGGMRQVGILAAGALHALRHHRQRLHEDHDNARALAERLAEVPGLAVDLTGVETNIVNIDLTGALSAEDFVRRAEGLGVRVGASGPQRVRAVTHLDVTRSDCLEAASRLAEAARR
jgi:threonine aldolase